MALAGRSSSLSDNTTRVIASIAESSEDAAIAAAGLAAREGADLVEFRLDAIEGPAPDVGRLLRGSPLPAIIADRKGRVELLRAAAGAAFVDADISVAGRLSDIQPARLIVSWHDFEKTPADLSPFREAALGLGAAVVKVATWASDAADCRIHAGLLATSMGPTVAIAMGQYGTPTRTLAGRLGAWATYGAVSPGSETAAGQPTVGDLVRLYRVRDQGSGTRVYGLLGDPVGHSLGPALHNRLLPALGVDGVYAPILARDADAACEAFREGWGIAGFSVTRPHKESVWLALDCVKDGCLRAVNTVVVEGGRLVGYNDDAPAVEAVVKAAARPTGGTALVLGAGGAGRAAAWALAGLGFQVVVAARRGEAADGLAADVGGQSIQWSDAIAARARVVVNATPVGQAPSDGETPVDRAVFQGRRGLAVDLVYRPRLTRFLGDAARAGWDTVDGVAVFVEQAARQAGRWSGRAVDRDMVRRIVDEVLAEEGGESSG